MLVAPPSRRTGFVCDEAYFRPPSDDGRWPGVSPGAAFETPAGKRRIRDLAESSGLLEHLVSLAASPLTRQDALRFHTADYVDGVAALSAGEGGQAGEETWVSPGGWETALLAAGGTWAAVRAVVAGEVDNAYALVRPPGHHAERGEARGYCLLANAALAVLKARAELGVGRVAVVDWDVHHGNGTEQAFLEDPDVLTVSLHQDRLYPRDSGAAHEVGRGAGRGAVVNVPLPAGSGSGAYADAFDRVVDPAVRAFRPDLLVVCCGYDAGAYDPLGRMLLSAASFGMLAGRVRALADALCGGRLAVTHEGGYSEMYAPLCGLRVLEELSGAATDVLDPFAHVDAYPAQALTDVQRAAVDVAAAAQAVVRSGLTGDR